ncbi:hypothetical protein BT96DRAFT_950926 [Gymnopus androsaceus JB14]|uniref:Uncharacterized protein n=1 Tax=Gymnopus androsaceus JB14 TaxID=1447944 RepID=A0A6A4GEL3_9AGAR|nr:hypothetical protein BT96DRAFT_950926 [Gymnopus androsaceus JB14]
MVSVTKPIIALTRKIHLYFNTSDLPPSLTGTVQMWRGIENDLANKIIHNVSASDIADGLWKDYKGRRRIRLGKYLQPLQENSNKEDAEDKLLLDPNAVKCPAELRSILDTHKQLITSLILDPSQQSVQKVPALAMMAVKQKLKIDATMYSGGLLDTDIAEINNWFHTTFPNATEIVIQGRHAYAIAHCRTLLMAHRHQDEFMAMEHNSSTDNIEQSVLQKAWERLQQWNCLTVDGKEKGNEVDVNFEAISLLDKIMFDRSERAGHAGNDQWGLDAGPHELCWGPTFSGPDVTEHGQEHEGDNDIELQKDADCDQVAEANELERAKALREDSSPKQPRPKPTLKLSKHQAATTDEPEGVDEDGLEGTCCSKRRKFNKTWVYWIALDSAIQHS